MREMYFARRQGDDIVVTRKSDRKTIAFPWADCLDATGNVAPFKVAESLAKGCDESNWR